MTFAGAHGFFESFAAALGGLSTGTTTTTTATQTSMGSVTCTILGHAWEGTDDEICGVI